MGEARTGSRAVFRAPSDALLESFLCPLEVLLLDRGLLNEALRVWSNEVLLLLLERVLAQMRHAHRLLNLR